MIRIMVVEDHTLVREGICVLLEQQDDMTVVLSESNSKDALLALEKARPDVAVVDMRKFLKRLGCFYDLVYLYWVSTKQDI